MRILIVEDSPSDRQLLRVLLEARFQKESKFREADSLKTAVAYLKVGNIDCVLLDLTLPDSTGRETFEKLHEQFPSVPIVVMTNNRDRNLAVNLIRAGAADYINKNFTDEEDLFTRIMFAIEKDRNSIRVPPRDVETIKKLDSARASLRVAQQEGGSIDKPTYEMTRAVAELSRNMFTELQKINLQLGTFGAEQKALTKQVEILDKELLRGHSTKPSMRTQVDVLQHRLDSHESDIRELREDIDEERQSVVDLEKEQVALKQRSSIMTTKITGRTKIILAVIALISSLIGILGSVYGIQQFSTDKVQAK